MNRRHFLRLEPTEARSLAEVLRKKMERAEESIRKIDPEELKRNINR